MHSSRKDDAASSVRDAHLAVRRRRTAWWVVVTAVSVSLTAAVAFSIVGLVVFANHDRLELLDLPQVAGTAEAACARLTTALEADQQGTDAERLLAGNDAIADLTAAMNALGPEVLAQDSPAEEWIEDWEALEQARSNLAEQLPLTPTAQLEVPRTSDGYPITERMADASGAECAAAIAAAATL